MKITLIDFKKTINEVIEIEGELSEIRVADIHQKASEQLDVPYTSISFIYKGYRLNDNMTLSEIKYVPESTILVSLKLPKLDPIEEEKQKKAKEKRDTSLNTEIRKTNNIESKIVKEIKENKTPVKQAPKKEEKKQYIQELNESLVNNKNPLDSFYGKEMMAMMMKQEPLKSMIEKNPDIANVLEDPEQLEQIMKLSRKPELMQQYMRNADAMMNMVENIPGGTEQLNKALGNLENDPFSGNEKLKYDPNLTNEHFKQDEILDKPFNLFENNQGNGNMNMGMNFGMGNPYGMFQPRQNQGLFFPNNNFNPQPPVDNRPPEEKYKKEIEMLKEMGFDEEKAVRALEKSKGNISGAIDYLASDF